MEGRQGGRVASGVEGSRGRGRSREGGAMEGGEVATIVAGGDPVMSLPQQRSPRPLRTGTQRSHTAALPALHPLPSPIYFSALLASKTPRVQNLGILLIRRFLATYDTLIHPTLHITYAVSLHPIQQSQLPVPACGARS